MSAITDCIIMVLIMRHGNAGEENIVLTYKEEFILQPFTWSNVGECEKTK